MRSRKNGFRDFARGSLVALLLSCSPAHADVVADWNAIALDLASRGRDGADAWRTMATVHVAMFEVMNFVEGGYVPRFLVKQPGPLAGSGEAVAAAAAHHVLLEAYPGRKAELDAALERSLAPVSGEHDRTSLRVWGTHLGANIRAAMAQGTAAPKAVPARTSLVRGAGDVARLNAMLARLIEGRALKPIEAARLHALAWMAAADAYEASGGSRFNVIGAATVAVLESEFATPDVALLTPRRREAAIRAD